MEAEKEAGVWREVNKGMDGRSTQIRRTHASSHASSKLMPSSNHAWSCRVGLFSRESSIQETPVQEFDTGRASTLAAKALVSCVAKEQKLSMSPPPELLSSASKEFRFPSSQLNLDGSYSVPQAGPRASSWNKR